MNFSPNTTNQWTYNDTFSNSAKQQYPQNNQPIWIGNIGGMKSQVSHYFEILTYNTLLNHQDTNHSI